MPARSVLRALLGVAALLACAAAAAQSVQAFFRAYAAQPDALARRQFLVDRLPQLSAQEQDLARQLLASTDSELGLYDRALGDFPFNQHTPLANWVPQPDTLPTHKLRDFNVFVDPDHSANAIAAAPAIARAAAGRRLVMINEAHHDAHTRVLVLQLLPLLRAAGFDYFAAEAITESGAALGRRGYPIAASGTEYLHEPLYGEIVREALRLGYTVVPYDPTDAHPGIDRDAAQADNLYRRVFARAPKARLFVLAGYAHIDKAMGQLGDVTPMAVRLGKLSRTVPLSIDQTQFRAIGLAPPGSVYRWMIASYHPRGPVVLSVRGEDTLWSGDPDRYDISVILPPPHGRQRPDWLDLDGARRRLAIDGSLCAGQLPCVVEARYAGESDDAIPADRYTFLAAPGKSRLYLRPGNYRLRAWGLGRPTLGERDVTVE